MSQYASTFWNLPQRELLQLLHTAQHGLSSADAARRLKNYAPRALAPRRRADTLALLADQFRSPTVLILAFTAGMSFFLGDATDAIIILAIVLTSGVLGFWQERGAADAVARLLAVVRVNATVLRDGRPTEVPAEQVVPGDVVVLAAGASIPADCLILASRDLFVDQAALTGETFPVEKTPGVLAADTPLGERSNTVYTGTHVVSGTAQAVVVHTGPDTEFGRVAERLRLRPPETAFVHGVRRFGYFLMEVTLLLVLAIFAINVYLARPVLDSLLFALALAVGLTPQLLPATISINLALGAKRMAGRQVIVKRLSSIEDFGSMNVLCADKTGTLTEGVVRLHAALGVDGQPSEKVLLYAYLNAAYETGFANPIDEAIRTYRRYDLSPYRKLDEVPYDFIRKRLSILIDHESTHLLVTKGAVANVLSVCTAIEAPDGSITSLDSARWEIERQFSEVSSQGLRAIAVAYRDLGSATAISKEHEADMTFLGFLVFLDPPKPNIAATLAGLRDLGVALKVITGDNRLVAANLAQQIGLPRADVITGPELRYLGDEALMLRANAVDVFAEVEPNQKERIILALRKTGNVVGYLGDGINDGPALHAADVGISVDGAVDVAKQAADIVLLQKDLGVLKQGISEGRTTFANTLKYVFMATSANFGNMFSMALASLFLPFLPLLPKQILLLNLLTNIPEMTIATDSVDHEWILKARRWNIGFIRDFMLAFGPLSSIFDILTFAVLLIALRASPEQFRAGWFIESLVSATIIVLVVRTRRPFFRSRPSSYLLVTTLLVAAVGLVLPFNWLGEVFGFVALPLVFVLALGAIVTLYVGAAEAAKKVFYRRESY